MTIPDATLTDFRTQGTQDEILRQVVDRLIEQVPEFSESNCFVSDQPTPVNWPSGSICCTVCVGEGHYPEEFFTGGGNATITKATTIKVTPYVRTKLDHSPHAEAALIGDDKGLVSRFEPLVLRSILCDEKDGVRVAWEPRNHDGSAMLRSQIAPASSTAPMPASDNDFLGMTINFDIEFDWNI